MDSLPVTFNEIEIAFKEWDYDIHKFNKFTYRFPSGKEHIQPIVYCEGSEVNPVILFCYSKAIIPENKSGMNITKAYKES